jgi:hypothetical protein
LKTVSTFSNSLELVTSVVSGSCLDSFRDTVIEETVGVGILGCSSLYFGCFLKFSYDSNPSGKLGIVLTCTPKSKVIFEITASC